KYQIVCRLSDASKHRSLLLNPVWGNLLVASSQVLCRGTSMPCNGPFHLSILSRKPVVQPTNTFKNRALGVIEHNLRDLRGTSREYRDDPSFHSCSRLLGGSVERRAHVPPYLLWY